MARRARGGPMPEPRLARLLSRLLPPRTRRDLFDPSAADLRGDCARAGRRAPRAALVLLFLDCWRLTPAEVLAMFFNDLRHAFRLLRRDVLFTATIVLTLTLGVGANVSVFAVVNAVLLRPLPYADAERLVMIEHRDTRTGLTKAFIAMGDHIDMRARQKAFEVFAGFGSGPTVIHSGQDSWEGSALMATAELLPALRVQPVAGRALESSDMHPNAARVAMIGYEFWQRNLGGDPGVVGRAIPIGLGRVPHQIVGIAPQGFRFPLTSSADVIMPLRLPADAPASRRNGWTFAVARLAEGVTLAQAQLAALSKQMELEHPEQNIGSEYYAKPLRDAFVGESRTALVQMLAAVGLVLLIACVNVANLLAARSLGRRQEMSVRVALGAGRRQILMQLVAESLALGVVSGVSALAFAYWAVPALVSLVPESLNLGAGGQIGLDGTVLIFAALVSLGTSLVFGLFSGLGLRRDTTAGALMSTRGMSGGAVARRASSALVVAEIAIAIVLLTGAGLVLRSFANLLSVDPGFRSANVLTLSLAAPPARYPDAPARAAFNQRVFDAIRALPGVQAAGTAAVMPLTGNVWSVPFDRADRPVPAGERAPDVGWQAATGGYFSALGIPLIEGRHFSTAQDGPDSPPVVIISEAIRARFFDGQPAVGRRVRLGDDEAEIVGVVGSIRRGALTDAPWSDMYFSQEQAPATAMNLFIRTSGDPVALIPAVREAVREVDPAILTRAVQTLDDVARESVQVTRLALWLLGLFALTALALAAVGIYGVMSYAIRQRMRELGTRVALGATPGSILRLVMGNGAKIAALGTGIGLLASFLAGRALRSLLFSTAPSDPAVLAGAAGLLGVTAMLACYLPARRASRVDPVRTLSPR
ncbi:MAG: ABC transporter permease [Acidobacteriota bacterium]|nr:ABC transporter permease [Acidobacteriota bacterium]